MTGASWLILGAALMAVGMWLEMRGHMRDLRDNADYWRKQYREADEERHRLQLAIAARAAAPSVLDEMMASLAEKPDAVEPGPLSQETVDALLREEE